MLRKSFPKSLTEAEAGPTFEGSKDRFRQGYDQRLWESKRSTTTWPAPAMVAPTTTHHHK
jgi:hypothetical protein